MLEWSRVVLNHETQPLVANSTAVIVFKGPWWRTVAAMHSVLYSPIVPSMRALTLL